MRSKERNGINKGGDTEGKDGGDAQIGGAPSSAGDDLNALLQEFKLAQMGRMCPWPQRGTITRARPHHN